MFRVDSALDRHKRAAHAAYAAGDVDALDLACRAVLKTAPDDIDARRLLGRQAMRETKLDVAEHYFREAAVRDPTSANSWVDVAKVLVERRRIADAEAVLAAADRRGVRTASALTLLGVTRMALGRGEDARAAFFTAVDLDRDHAHALRWLGELGGLAPSDPLHQSVARRLDSGEFPPARAALAAFALAEAAWLEDDYPRFIHRLSQANAMQSARLDGLDPHLDALKLASKSARPKRQTNPIAIQSDPPMVFILGAAGAGAALAEHALGAVSLVRMGGVLGALAGHISDHAATLSDRPAVAACHEFDRDSRVRLAERYLSRVAQLEGDLAWPAIDSDTRNAGLAPFAAALFANAKFIRIKRDSRDAGLSVYRRAFGQPQLHTCDLRAIGRGLVLTDAALDAFAEVRGDVVEASYEALIDDPMAEALRLARAAELPLRDVAMTPPAIAAGLGAWEARIAETRIERGSWTQFADQLAPMIRAIEGS